MTLTGSGGIVIGSGHLVTEACDTCHGTGKVTHSVPPDGMTSLAWKVKQATCSECNGKGKITWRVGTRGFALNPCKSYTIVKEPAP